MCPFSRSLFTEEMSVLWWTTLSPTSGGCWMTQAVRLLCLPSASWFPPPIRRLWTVSQGELSSSQPTVLAVDYSFQVISLSIRSVHGVAGPHGLTGRFWNSAPVSHLLRCNPILKLKYKYLLWFQWSVTITELELDVVTFLYWSRIDVTVSVSAVWRHPRYQPVDIVQPAIQK